MKTREEINEELKKFLFNREDIIAVWEGGSAATGFLDQYSDLDLAIVCEDDSVEPIFKVLDKYLEENFCILKKFRVPEPSWHGFSQCFYQLDKVPEFFYMDIALIKRSNPNKFTESDRHGESSIWFEKEKMVDPTPTPKEEVIAKGKKMYKMISSYDFLTIIELKKALARGLYAEAFSQYNQLISRNLGVMLNLKYRPCKADFGTRYYYRDLPKEEFEKFQDYLKVISIEELSEKSVKLLEQYDNLKEELKEEWG